MSIIIIIIMLRLVTVCRPAKAYIFYSGHPNVCTAIIIIIKTEVIPLVVGVLCTVKTRMVENRKHLKLSKRATVTETQKICVLGSAWILRRMLSVWTEWLTWVADAPGAWFVHGWCTKRKPAKTVTEEVIIIITTTIIITIIVTKGSVKGFYHVILLEWRPCEKLR